MNTSVKLDSYFLSQPKQINHPKIITLKILQRTVLDLLLSTSKEHIHVFALASQNCPKSVYRAAMAPVW